MRYLFPSSVFSSESFGYLQIPFVYGIPSAEAFGIPDIPKFSSVLSSESVSSPQVGIWWLKWRDFDNKDMFVKKSKAFSSIEDRRRYANQLILDLWTKPYWKFKTAVFGMPFVPKDRIWNKIEIYLKEILF